MPRIIFKCPYLKGGAKSASHLNNYVRYMATREGAQHLSPDRAQCPVTEPQKQLVERLLRDFPLSRGLFEYEDYVAAPTQGNASEFITRALEDNADQISKRENYVDYIASRPRAQRRGSHALFTDTDDPLVLSQIADAVAHHPGNIWLPIISLRREDAARLGEIGTVFPPLEADEPVIPSPEWQTLTAVDTPPEQVQMLLEQLTQAAEAGQAPAQYTLGRLYRDGGSVEKNHLRSVIWLTQAAKQGDRCAMYALGKLYLEKDDLPTAMRWFQQSAELGYTLAQYHLGKLLLESGDADRNTEAVRWLTGAAECGDPYAQYALGKLYLLGKQVPPDHDAAVRWLEQSAAQGNKSARATLERMERFRGPSVLSAATRLLHHMSRIFQEQSTSGPIASIRFTDSKLRQRIREKKIAMGHKPDDHEDQEIRMS